MATYRKFVRGKEKFVSISKKSKENLFCMRTLFSYFQQFSLPKVRKTRLQADFVTNNQILVVKIIKIRPPHLVDFMNFSNLLFSKTPRLFGT